MTVSIVTQTSVRPERSEDFARWQGETSNMVASFPGFVEQRLMPPNPPLQVDWVILQRFHTMESAARTPGGRVGPPGRIETYGSRRVGPRNR